jgi:NADH-quinone oxidoreductase subunit N
MKTYLLGALFGIVLVLGVTVLYGIGGATAQADLVTGLAGAPSAAAAFGLLAVLAGLLFEAGGVPGHFWVPDATQSAGTTAAAFLTTVPKVGALVAAYRLATVAPGSVDRPLLVAVLAALTMTLGNLAALAQTDVRRLLGWSTVSQVGYLLLPVAVAGRSADALPSLLVYLGGYAVTNLAAFAVVAAVPGRRTVDEYRGLAPASPWLAGALVVALLSLVGTPPTAVFTGKLTTFTAAWDGGLAWLVVVAAANTVASLFYYLRWIAPAFRRADEDRGPGRPRPFAAVAAVLAGGCVLTLGLAVGAVYPLVDGPLAR